MITLWIRHDVVVGPSTTRACLKSLYSPIVMRRGEGYHVLCVGHRQSEGMTESFSFRTRGVKDKYFSVVGWMSTPSAVQEFTRSVVRGGLSSRKTLWTL